MKSFCEVICPEDEEHLLYPVRALECYLTATKGILLRPRSLFISVKDHPRSLSLNAVSFFIRETIQQVLTM